MSSAIENDIANLLPPELQTAGWRLHESAGGKWRAKNQKLGLFSSACDYPTEAVEAARALADGKTATLSGDGAVTFKAPPSADDHVIRCPECGDSNDLEPKFIDQGKYSQRIESFTCPMGHTFANDDPKARGAKPKAKEKRPKQPATILAQPLPNFCLIERKDLEGSKTNARENFDDDKLQELAESIRTQGIIEPLIVRKLPRPGKYEIVAGERRYKAAALVKLHWLPCIIRTLTDKEAEEIQTIENDQREDLNPIERGAGYLKLIERHGHTPETLAAAVNKSKTFIYDQIKLAKLPDVARKALLEGKIPQSTATLIARIPSEKLRANAAQEIIGAKPYFGATYESDTLSFRQAKALIERKFSLQLKGTVFSREDATLVPAAGACTNCPKLTGNNRVEFPDGRADVCTDPQCFNQKIAAHDARTRTKAKDNEIKVLSASETKKLFSYGSLNRYGAGEAYIDLAEQCSQDTAKKKRSYKQLLGDAVAPLLAINPQNHRAHYLVTKKLAAPILLKNHKIKISVPNSSSSSSRSSRPDPAIERRKEEKKKLFQRAVYLAGDEIALQAEVDAGPGFRGPALATAAALFFKGSLQCPGNDDLQYVAERLGILKPPQGKQTGRRQWGVAERAIEKWAKTAAPEQLFAVGIEFEFIEDANDYNQTFGERATMILKAFPRVGAFDTYLDRARDELTKPPDPPPAKLKAKAAGRNK